MTAAFDGGGFDSTAFDSVAPDPHAKSLSLSISETITNTPKFFLNRKTTGAATVSNLSMSNALALANPIVITSATSPVVGQLYILIVAHGLSTGVHTATSSGISWATQVSAYANGASSFISIFLGQGTSTTGGNISISSSIGTFSGTGAYTFDTVANATWPYNVAYTANANALIAFVAGNRPANQNNGQYLAAFCLPQAASSVSTPLMTNAASATTTFSPTNQTNAGVGYSVISGGSSPASGWSTTPAAGWVTKVGTINTVAVYMQTIAGGMEGTYPSISVASSITEAITTAYALTKTSGGGSSKTLTFSIAEVEAYTTSFNRTRASIVPIIETEVFVSALRRFKPAALTITETTTLAQALKRTRLSSFTIAETEAIVVAFGKLKGLGFSVSEINATLYTLGRSRIAALNIAETISDALILQRSRVAGLSIAETITNSNALGRNRVVSDGGGSDPFWNDTVLAMHMEDATDLKGHTASVTDASFAAGKFGNALVSNGSTTSISFPYSTDFDLGTGDFTIDFWLTLNAGANYGNILSMEGPVAGSFNSGLQIAAGRLRFSFFTGSGYSPQTTIYTDVYSNPSVGTFKHYAVIRSGGTVQIYVDGVASGSSASLGNIYVSGNNLNFGADAGGDTACDVRMDDLRITKAARWTTNFTPPTASFAETSSAGMIISETLSWLIDLTKSGAAGGPKDLALAIAEVETMVIAESIKRGLVFTELENQALVIATIARARKLVEAISETTGMTNALGRGRTGSFPINETTSLTNNIARNRGVVTNINETTGMTASLNRLKGIALALAETYSYIFSFVKVKLLTTTVDELETFSFGGLRRTKQIAEAISEVINHSASFNRTRTSSVTINELETVQEALNRVRQVQETISQLETVTTSLARRKQIATTVSELQALTIALTKSALVLKLLAMGITETETVSMLAGRVRNLVYNSLSDVQGGGGVSNPNMLGNPDTLSIAPWSATSLTITNNAIANPLNGTVNGTRIAEPSNSATGYYLQQSVSIVNNTYTMSCYVKADQRTNIQIRNVTQALFATFNLSSATVANVSAGCTASITAVTGGWYRLVFTFTASFGAGAYVFRWMLADATNNTIYSYGGIAGYGMWVYGLKFELGATVSNYLASTPNNGEYETLAASFNRSRAFIVPIGETENFTLNFGRMRKQLMNITETQGVSAAFARIRTLLQDIANTTNYSFTVITSHSFGGTIKVTVTWTEWVTDGIYQKQVNHSEEILCLAASGSDHSVQTSDGSTVVIPDAEFNAFVVETQSGTFTVVPTGSV